MLVGARTGGSCFLIQVADGVVLEAARFSSSLPQVQAIAAQGRGELVRRAQALMFGTVAVRIPSKHLNVCVWSRGLDPVRRVQMRYRSHEKNWQVPRPTEIDRLPVIA